MVSCDKNPNVKDFGPSDASPVSHRCPSIGLVPAWMRPSDMHPAVKFLCALVTSSEAPVTTSKAPVTTSKAPVTTVLVRHLFLLAYCYWALRRGIAENLELTVLGNF